MKIKLRKCAFIFDESHRNYFYSKEQREQAHLKQRILKRFYDFKEERAKEFDAVPVSVSFPDGDTITAYEIIIDGAVFRLNALEIASTDNDGDIFNHRKIKTFENFKNEKFTDPKAWADFNRIYSKTFKTLEAEAFAGIDDLGYYRLHFKNNYITFIIDDRTGETLTAEGVEHRPLAEKEIFTRLEITSNKAKKELKIILDYLKN